jgi:hypothetical protein
MFTAVTVRSDVRLGFLGLMGHFMHATCMDERPPQHMLMLFQRLLVAVRRGFGTVRFLSQNDALAACAKLNNTQIEGRTISVRIDRFA